MRPVILFVAGRALPTLLPMGLCALLAWAVWRAFGGGFIGSDGEWQLQQAFAGQFNDWLSPTMTAVLRQGLFHYFSLAPVVLIQAVVICTGLFHLLRANLRFLGGNPASPGKEAALAMAIVTLLLVPPSPLPYFLVYLQSDSWLLAGLLWSLAGWLNLELTHASSNAPHNYRLARVGWWSVAILGSGWMVLMRYNAAVLLPVFGLLAMNASRHRHRLIAISLAAGVVVLPLASGRWIDRRYHVEHVHPEDQIIALDLVGICVECDEMRQRLPYTNAHLIEDRFRRLYLPAFVNVYYWYSPEESRPTRLEFVGELEGKVQRYGSRHEELVGDYRQAIWYAPFTLAKVKWTAFVTYLKNDQVMHWHPTGGLPDTYGRKPAFSVAVRTIFSRVDEVVGKSPSLKFAFSSHMPWFILCMLGVSVMGLAAWRGGFHGRRRTGLFLLLIPTVYYLSHLLAVAGHWYRYMYPATLVMQMEVIVIGSLAAGSIWRRMRSIVPAEQAVLGWRIRLPAGLPGETAPERAGVADYTHPKQPA